MKLSGFKSFVDPITIDLPGQLIAVVGPNGCGKSNIIDAVRWVLGESSAKNLRGDSMTDVIFNGASSRRAVGQASVELRFDNQLGKLGGQFNQYQEISIKRSVNRDGDSAYYLNGKRCRRRDITDMFLGTGAGSRGYSIISQGTISQLIEAKPMALRAYLEEAAGISKYKERRRETLQRIEHTNANLARVNDICQELDKQIQRLQRQAKTAERYQALKQEANQCRLKISALKWQQYDQQKQAYQQQLEVLAEQIATLKRQRASLINEANMMQQTLHQGQIAYQAKQQAYYEQQSMLARLEEKASQHEKERNNLLNDQQNAQQSWHQIEQTIVQEQENLKQSQQNRFELNQQISNMTAQYEAAKQTLQSLSQQQQQQEQAHRDLIQKQQQKQHELNVIELKLEQLTDKRQQLLAQLDHTDRQEFNEIIQQCRTKKTDLTSQQQEKVQAITALEISIQHDIGLSESHQQSISKRQQTIQQLETKYQQALRQKTIVDASIEAQTKVSHQNTPAILKDKSPIFQQLTVAPEWQASIQWIATHILRGYHCDKTVIKNLPLDMIKLSGQCFSLNPCSPVSQERKTLASVIDGPIPAGDIAFDRIWLTDTLESAWEIQSKLDKDESILSKDGFWLGPDWLRCMPAKQEKTTNLLALSEEQKSLDSTLNQISETISTERAKQQDNERTFATVQSQLKQSQTSLNEMRSAQQQLTVEMSLCDRQMQQAEKEKSRLDTLAQECQYQLEAMIESQVELDAQKEIIEKEIESINIKVQQFDNLATQQAQVDAWQKEVDSLLHQKQESLLQHQKQQQNEQNHQQQLTYWQSQKDMITARIEDIAERLITFQQTNTNTDTSKLDLLKQSQEKEKIALESDQAELTQQEYRLQDIHKQTEARQQQASTAEQEFQTVKLKEQEAQIRLEEVCNQLDQYQTSPSDALSQLTETDHLETLDQQLSHCNTRIQQMGAVNLAAKAELDEETARKKVLDEQQNDLLEAIESLNQAIHKIDKETRTRFHETFEQVNTTFQQLFPRVFGGGKALLKLEGDDWLESGVVVMAQPPGKRNSTIHLLSGGEKALTAVALVFALFQLNPSPFCLLDEVDAPLDDVNVGRFCQLVKQMSHHVQFIFITHNKVTMTLAEQLIGVTMREPGVSRLVAVDVAEALAMSEQ